MAQSTVRTAVIFSVITLLLGGIVIGGVRLLKVRDNSYASTSRQPAKPAQSQPVAAQPQPAHTDNAPAAPKVATNPTPAATAPSTVAPKETPTVPVAPAPSPQTPASTSGKLPETSDGSQPGLLLTGILMALSVWFGARLLKAKASYRHYLEKI